ncbi:hypothetical protein DFA_01749 [Cavenderia fasciculata]|uniref:SD-repeat containing protein B domain-containing protein n=1 Tax=Cavenderia fasciculata TaxID=261658 RepID=F4PUJ9_CACFS|nr:uncharacterized protein DFA_01749 [Cavenderia fasciculata]EGG21863.1 hypothetical protein DFA_01749 [Cavenderia fasciculata]|eukprot:XP_004359714.1 hypothetical protein DFA_01749 [Cavenderia fasciculata]
MRLQTLYTLKFFNPANYYFPTRNDISYTCNLPVGSISTSLANCLRPLSSAERIGVEANILATGITAFQLPMVASPGAIANASVVTLMINIIPPTPPPIYQVSGRIFIDRFAWNDVASSANTGFAINITVYDKTGAYIGAASTNMDGKYALSLLRGETYKIVFQIPDTHISTGTATTFFAFESAIYNIGIIQKANTGKTLRNFDPVSFAVSCFVVGSRSGPNADLPAMVSISANAVGNGYDASGSKFVTKLSKHFQVGAVSGIVYEPTSRNLYASALWKYNADFGPAGPCGIYMIDYLELDGSGANSIYADLSIIFGDNNYCGPQKSHNFTDRYQEAAMNMAGKMSFGGMTTDYRFLYVANLYRREINVIPLFETPNAANVRSIPVPNPGCADARDWRIFAVTFDHGALYVGGVCSGEFGGAQSMGTYVLRSSESKWQIVVSFPLTFARGCTNYDGGKCDPAEWSPWRAGLTQQPQLSGIYFNTKGRMILSFRNRIGDNAKGINPALDMLILCLDITGNWVLEYNGKCGKVAGYTQSRFGPGGGHFFNTELIGTHQYASSLFTAHAGSNDLIVSSGYDYVDYYTGSLRWFNASTGQVVKGFQVYNSGAGVGGFDKTFDKANGLGDIAPIYPASAINQCGLFYTGRVWNDTNGNGIQDAGEMGISNVKVIMGSPHPSTCITDQNGYFTFSGKSSSPHAVYITINELARRLTGPYKLSPKSECDADVTAFGYQTSLTSPAFGGYYFNKFLFGITWK